MIGKPLGMSILAMSVLTLAAVGCAFSPLSVLPALVLPYAAFATFLGGFVYRIAQWAKAPVPFRITATCGQQLSLPWLRRNPLDCPSDRKGVLARMFLEVFLFRSLFRNSDMKIAGGRPVYGSAKWLWLFALLFHGSLLLIVLRHLRFFVNPIAPGINTLSAIDGFFEIGTPTLYLSDAALLAGLVFLLLRRILVPRLRYISLATDWFALLLILGIGATGILIRHFFPADLVAVKNMALGWITFAPTVPQGIGAVAYVHLCLVFTLLAWFPFSKLMHLGGIFLSPTRNLANDNRMHRHVNPWNAPVKVHTYEEYEEEFREKMKLAGLPVEKE